MPADKVILANRVYLPSFTILFLINSEDGSTAVETKSQLYGFDRQKDSIFFVQNRLVHRN